VFVKWFCIEDSKTALSLSPISLSPHLPIGWVYYL
jgi:hypothetical protein